MKFRRVLLLLSLLCLSTGAFAQEKDTGLRIKIECEEPGGVLWDRDTLQTSRSVLFSINVFNTSELSRIVTLNWKISDAAGRNVLDSKEKYTIPAKGLATRRELFAPKGRGGFILNAWAESKTDGPDLKANASFPFAILSTPSEEARHPLVLLDTPLLTQDANLDFYQRIGARALRSTIPIQDDSLANTEAMKKLDASLQARSSRGLSMVGVLSAPPRSAMRDDEEWLQAALQFITRYRDIRTWEIVGNPAPDTLSEIARAARNMSPPRSVLSVLQGSGAARTALDGAIFFPPINVETNAAVHPATLRRAFITDRIRSREANQPTFHIRENGSGAPSSASALEVAGDFTARAVLALSAGADGSSADIESGNIHEKFACGAAYAALVNMLGDAQFSSDAFPESPLVMAHIFARNSGGTVAVLWSTPDQSGKTPDGKISAWLPEGQVYDVFGNPLAGAQRKALDIPLGSVPVYLTSSARPEEVLRALREGAMKSIAPLSVQVLPITQPLEKPSDKKSDGKAAPLVKTLIRVRMQNTGTRQISGRLEVNPPPSWKLETSMYAFDLVPGESRIYVFGASQTKANDEYPVVVKALADEKSGKGSWGWKQMATIATATSVPADHTMSIDGKLDDWQDTEWMKVSSSSQKRVSGQLGVKWDARNLYIGARVKEDHLQPRQSEDTEYAFWKDSDAIQLGFGWRDGEGSNPSGGPFRDTDAGFLLSPFHTRADGTLEGRVLRLWNNQLPFGGLPDHIRWGGAVPGARCEIRRDERTGESVYEAMIPLSELPDLRPAARLASASELDNPVRFSFVMHCDELSKEGGALQWAASNNVFPWWNHTGSFLPEQSAYLAAQTLLGFAQRGELANGATTLPLPPPPSVTPSPAAPAPPSTVAPPPTPAVPPMPLPAIPPQPSVVPLPPPPVKDTSSEVPPYIPPPQPTPTPKPQPPAAKPPKNTPLPTRPDLSSVAPTPKATPTPTKTEALKVTAKPATAVKPTSAVKPSPAVKTTATAKPATAAKTTPPKKATPSRNPKTLPQPVPIESIPDDMLPPAPNKR